MQYRICKTTQVPALDGDWQSSIWALAQTAQVKDFHPRSSEHRPKTTARVLYDDEALYVMFHVEDQFVRSVRTALHDSVCADACVEFFFEPALASGQKGGYFNFEINCGGTMLVYYITGTKTNSQGDQEMDYVPFTPEHAKQVGIAHCMPSVVDPQITEPVQWTIQYRVPYSVLQAYAGPLNHTPGSTWRGNFYKCAHDGSGPHWASWAPIGQKLNFHKPHRFADLVLESV